MNEGKKKKNIFAIIMTLFFIVFISLYFTGLTDMYEVKQHNKMVMTKEAMQKFEKDISEGRDIEIENYLDIVEDYTNDASRLGNKTSKLFENIMSKGIIKTFKLIGKLFT